MADPLGFYKKEGLNVSMMKTAGWALIRDKVLNKEYDASHMLAPMPIAISMGVGSNASPTNVMTIQNINGQAIVLANKHKDNRDPKNWKGFKFAIPFEFSMHNCCCATTWPSMASTRTPTSSCAWCRRPRWWPTCAPATSTASSARSGQPARGVRRGRLHPHPLARDLGRPPLLLLRRADGVHQAEPEHLRRALPRDPEAAAMARDPKSRPIMAEGAGAGQLPEPAQGGARTGAHRQVRRRPGQREERAERVDYDPFPWYSMAYWILTQMKRWGYVKGDVNYKDIAEKVYLLTDAKKYMAEVGMTPPKETTKKFKVMGKEFDPA
jgi:nitrate/nitrite transport system substrate-binding protein